MKNNSKNLLPHFGSGGGLLFKLLIVLISLQLPLSAFATKEIPLLSMKFENVTFASLTKEIEKQTGYRFLYRNENVESLSTISVDCKEKAMDQIINEVLAGTNLSFKIVDKTVVLMQQQQQTKKEMSKLSGTVFDTDGEPLPGVTVLVKGSTLGAATDIDGRFEITVPNRNDLQLEVSFIGMQKQIIKVGTTKEFKITLQPDANEMDEVVVTGVIDKSKHSFTGSVINVKGDEIKKTGSLNLLQAISVFDPAVRTIPNNEFGSDPNRVPDISIRGENGFDLRGSADDSRSNPNAPLYIMDGIEVSATKVYDFDMNRIESFTILKDASATSLYGSRAANGVIVITTVKPKPGEIRVSITTNYTISTPDLTDYNLMNAEEKLEYERLAGRYIDPANNKETQMRLDREYNERLTEVKRGVDTYWLSQPLRTALNQRYSAFIEGGDKTFQYGLDLRYDTDKGVMKGSGRDKYGINVNLNYQWNNRLFLRNDLEIAITEGENSPYGSFATFALQNPYDRIHDKETGDLVSRFSSTNETNPLYNAMLPNFDRNRYTEFKENFTADWRLNDHFRVNGRISLSKKMSKNEVYRSPSSTDFDQVEELEKKGSYRISNQEDINVDGMITATYNNTFAEKYMLSMGAGANLTTSSNIGEGFTATGFLSDNMNYVGNAIEFKENSTPIGVYDKAKMVGFFGTINIGYDNRYFIDGSFRTDGSSRFGKESRFAPFWSVGAAWNLNQEDFWQWGGTAKLRGSVGSTGTVNFSSDQALTRFIYNADNLYNGVFGAVLNAYGNPSLKWQNTLQYNVGLDWTLFNNFIVLNLDAYLKQTQNLLLPIDVAPSTGFTSYTENMGSMENKGVDIRLRLNILKGDAERLGWSLTLAGSHNRNKIKDLSNALEAMNEEAYNIDNAKGPQPLRIYEAGRSQSALMVVPSLGIDPATGNELYQELNGDITFDYNPRDKVIVGDENPKLQGNIQNNLNYKGWNLYFSFAYEMGAVAYNQTLASKVEGCKKEFNADRRVLYNRWKKPGDKAMYRRIDDESPVYQSSRFVQDNDFLSLQSASISYDMPRDLLKKTFMERLRITVSSTDLFRISTIKQERGTAYPFARTITAGLNVTF